MIGLLPVAAHDGFGGCHHMVPHILRGTCRSWYILRVTEVKLDCHHMKVSRRPVHDHVLFPLVLKTTVDSWSRVTAPHRACLLSC